MWTLPGAGAGAHNALRLHRRLDLSSDPVMALAVLVIAGTLGGQLTGRIH